jgi:diketogulonate reductase-like aldo/keto reductase
MNTNHADSTLVTHSLVVRFGETEVYPYLHHLLDKGKTRYISLSNASPDFIRKFKNEFGDQFFAHEGHVSFEVRVVQDKGVFDTCNELGVTNIIWRPLRQNRTSTYKWPLLVELANKYNKTQNQIVLNWIVKEGYYPMVMSLDELHIDENLSATDFTMSDDDYQQMKDFRPSNYNPPVVDWEKNGKGESIVTIVDGFEKHVSI